MSSWRWKTTERRVGVLGLANSGKTVFLTSLVNHLAEHDPDRFRLGDTDDRAEVRRFGRLPAEPGWAEFPYAEYRNALVHEHRWPRKTLDRSQFACRFDRTDWGWSDCLLKLHDLPGERLADAAMMGRSYAEWSDHVAEWVRADATTAGCFQEFLRGTAKDGLPVADLLHRYKLGLAKLTEQFSPLVTPSAFLLGTDGGRAKPMPAEAMALDRHSGTAADEEFAPFPAEARVRRPEVARLFAERYERYRSTVVEPFFAALAECHSLVVLVDVATILAAGDAMYEANRAILRDLLAVLKPGEDWLKWLGGRAAHALLPQAWRPSWVRRIAFVAPKMDLIAPRDRDRFRHLLESMVRRLTEPFDGLTVEYFNCVAASSVRAKEEADGGAVLFGHPYRGPDGKKLPPPSGVEGDDGVRLGAAPRLPDEWPRSWRAGVYVFPEVWPRIPRRRDAAPEQTNLDRVLGFVLE